MVQAASVRDRKSRALFDAAAARVHAVCRVHERLYRLPGAGRIQLAGFLRDLAGDLQETGLFETPPEIRADLADDIEVGMDAAISIGLIVNEALTNAAKYGRSRDGGYHIRLGLAHEPGGILLTVADQGRGQKPRKGRGGLGIMIVETLAATLKARLELRRKPGTEVRVSIPLRSTGNGDPVTALH
jgi:two-component sensor histidine kinase